MKLKHAIIFLSRPTESRVVGDESGYSNTEPVFQCMVMYRLPGGLPLPCQEGIGQILLRNGQGWGEEMAGWGLKREMRI